MNWLVIILTGYLMIAFASCASPVTSPDITDASVPTIQNQDGQEIGSSVHEETSNEILIVDFSDNVQDEIVLTKSIDAEDVDDNQPDYDMLTNAASDHTVAIENNKIKDEALSSDNSVSTLNEDIVVDSITPIIEGETVIHIEESNLARFEETISPQELTSVEPKADSSTEYTKSSPAIVNVLDQDVASELKDQARFLTDSPIIEESDLTPSMLSSTEPESVAITEDLKIDSSIINRLNSTSIIPFSLVVFLVLLLIWIVNRARRKTKLKDQSKRTQAAPASVALDPPMRSSVVRTEIPTVEHTMVKAVPKPAIERGERDTLDPMYSAHIDSSALGKQTYTIPAPPSDALVSPKTVRWISSREKVTVKEHEITGGMIYVGSRKPRISFPAYINISLPVTRNNDVTSRLISYWPKYSEISPEARGAYLTWLATGRKDPNADVGYIFLFFYGLEHRIFVDYPKGEVSNQELNELRIETERLYEIYGERSRSVRNYLSDFIGLLLLLEQGDEQLYDREIPDFVARANSDFYFKVLLGQSARDGIPITAEQAYLWVTYHPDIVKRTPVTRCTNEFEILFKLRYQRKYPNGIILPRGDSGRSVFYKTASNCYDTSVLLENTLSGISDLFTIPAVFTQLQDVVNECTTELDRYSRYIGRNMDLPREELSIAFLPADLIAKIKQQLISAIRNQMATREHMFVVANDCLKKVLNDPKPSRENLQTLAKVLATHQMGMEPDVEAYRFDVEPTDAIMLFPLSTSADGIDISSNYLLYVLVAELAIAVAKADGVVESREIEAINRYFDRLEDVPPLQLERLHKHVRFLQQTPPKETRLKRRLKKMSRDKLFILLAAVNQVVRDSGAVDHSEMEFLEKIYRYLDVDSQILYQLEQHPEKISVIEGHEVSTAIDFDRIASLKRESAEVSAMLASVFLDDEDQQEEPETFVEEEYASNGMFVIDDAQMVFLNHLVTKSSWDRATLVALANSYGVMLDGTIELINEQALDYYDMPLIEGEDPIEIAEELREEGLW